MSNWGDLENIWFMSKYLYIVQNNFQIIKWKGVGMTLGALVYMWQVNLCILLWEIHICMVYGLGS